MARTTIPPELVAVNAIQGTLIADNSVTAVHIATNAISGTLVADNAITSTHIAQNNVTATQIAQNTITVTQIADSAVETAKINNDAVTQAKIADDAVGPDQLAANSVVSASIANGTIVEADMADNAVTLAKMASLARGKIIVGDSAGDPSALAIGSNGTVLKSDGTDVSWGTAGVAGISSSADATAITIDSSENVGIGGTPQTTVGILDIVGQSNNFNTAPMLTFKTTSTNAANRNWSIGPIDINYGDFHIGCGDSNSDFFDATSHSKLTINKNGNVGIGNNTPAKFLDVGITTNAAAVDANIRLSTHYGTQNTARGGIQWYDGSDETGQIDTRYDGTTVDMHFGSLYNSGYNTTSRMVIKGNGKVGIGTTSPNEPLTIRSPDENINTTLLEIGNDLHAANTKDAWMKFVCGAAQNDYSWAIGAYPGSFRFNYLGARATAVTTTTAEKMRLEADGVSIGDTDGDFENRNGSEGLHVKRGGILMSGHPGDANMSSDTNGNQWTYHGQGGRGGSFTSVYFSIPNPNNGASGVGYGGFSVEFYIAGYNGKHHSGHYSGYVNGGITQAGAGFYSSSGSASLSAASVGVQGFKITVSFPSITHPTAKFIVNKGGHGGSAGNAAWTDMSGTQIGWA